jgi:hypothetical protein
MQEFEALSSRLSALGVRVRCVAHRVISQIAERLVLQRAYVQECRHSPLLYRLPALSGCALATRSVTAQHGDIPAMLARRGCELDFVEIISDPSFSICKDYEAKGLDLILATEEREQLLEGMVERDGFESKDAAKHNMVQPAVTVEDAEGNLLYTWSWHDEGTVGEYWDSDGKQIDGALKDGVHIVTIRPTAESLLAAIEVRM